MYQLIYSIIAIVLVGILTLHVMLSMTTTQRRQAVNEIATQMTEIGTEALERIGRTAFDERSKEKGKRVEDWPLLSLTDPLKQPTTKGSTEWGYCAVNGIDFWHKACDDLDDFDQLVTQWTREDLDGIIYTVEVTVNYVDPNAPTSVVSGPTLAKEVVVEISNPHFTYGGTPYKVRLSRVFVYTRFLSAVVKT
jgi:type II secretory pathway pseudopilin PulG